MPDRNVLLSEIMERIDQLREMEVLPTVPSIAPGTPCEVWDNHEARRMLAYFGRWECGKAMCSVEKNSGHYDPFDNAVPIVGNRGVDWSGVPRNSGNRFVRTNARCESGCAFCSPADCRKHC